MLLNLINKKFNKVVSSTSREAATHGLINSGVKLVDQIDNNWDVDMFYVC